MLNIVLFNEESCDTLTVFFPLAKCNRVNAYAKSVTSSARRTYADYPQPFKSNNIRDIATWGNGSVTPPQHLKFEKIQVRWVTTPSKSGSS